MGVKFKRNYQNIIQELMDALEEIDKIYEFFEMKKTTWNKLEEERKRNCLKTLSGDIVYGLGATKKFNVGQGIVKYDRKNNLIKVIIEENYIKVIKLV